MRQRFANFEQTNITPLQSMLRILFVLFLFLFVKSEGLYAQVYTGPIPIPASGYGSFGDELMDSVTFSNPTDPSDTSLVYFPQGIFQAVPTVFFMAGNGGVSPVYYHPYFRFIVSKGYAVVFVPVPTSQPTLTRYANMTGGFIHAARNYSNIIDTTKVGLTGHSFGGGACFAIGYDLFEELNWGSAGRFLMPTAQWYSYDISQTELQSYPSNTFLLSIIFYNDVVCDHRMAVDIFDNISIPAADKDIVMVTSSVYMSYNYSADHVLPNTTASYDAMDYYVIYRLTDALMDLAFNGNAAARNTALGDGDPQQINMTMGLNPLLVSDTLSAWFPETIYGYPCSSTLNPRINYCSISVSIEERATAQDVAVYPVPSGDFVFLSARLGAVYNVIDLNGEIIQSGTVSNSAERIDISFFSSGVYFIKCEGKTLKIIRT
ncbi:MAG: hypothetical protein RL007_247 [Bacteroidota bacterium]